MEANIEYKNILGIAIRQDAKTGFLNLSDLKEAYTQARVKNGWVEKNISRIMSCISFRCWFEGAFGLYTPPIFGAQYLKENGFQITTGARHTKTVWVHKDIFLYVEDRLFNDRKDTPSFNFENRCVELLSSVLIGVVPFVTQYKVLGYRVDFYFESLNLCVEFDEPRHNSPTNKKYDEERQSLIEKELGCTFLRARIGEEILLINKILRYLIQSKYNGTTSGAMEI